MTARRQDLGQRCRGSPCGEIAAPPANVSRLCSRGADSYLSPTYPVTLRVFPHREAAQDDFVSVAAAFSSSSV